jgi:microcystin-dependent protein
MTLYKWSQTAANNATADGLINWQEGQAPSSVNDSGRAMMAAVAKYRDDVSGAITTSGTSTAYAVSSFEAFDTLAHLGGQTIAFTPHVTNGATVTLNVDGLGAKPLRSSPGAELPAGSLILGTPYVALYNSSDAVWYLQGGIGGANAYSIPLGAGMDYWGSTTPSSIFAFPAGQAISRTTYATLFSLIGTTYGTGDGSTTFNLPDKTGRVSAMKESSATRLTTAGGGVDGATLGSANSGNVQNVALSQANLPAATLTTTVNSAATGITAVTRGQSGASFQGNVGTAASFGGNSGGPADQIVTIITDGGHAHSASTALGGSGTAFKIVQPTIVCNYIIRVL